MFLLQALSIIPTLWTISALPQHQKAFEAKNELRLIQTSDSALPPWTSEDEILEMQTKGIKFMDITEFPDLGKANSERFSIAKAKFPEHPIYQEEVKAVIANISTEYMEDNIKAFTGFNSRYYKSSTGQQSGEWLFELVKATAIGNPNISVIQFHHSWKQHSIIAKIPGSKSESIVIVGAHQDSANLFLPSLMPSPGADDDASGTVTILEALRSLVSVGFQPEKTVEFHWYSAEEGGLLGSQAVFSEYEKKNKDVVAFLQQDMTGYIKKTLESGKPESVGVITDFVHKGLTTFIKTIITEYCTVPFVETTCGYACSDHASASKAGYPSAFVIESDFKDSNPHIHTIGDTVDKLSFDHMKEHTKLTIGFVVELSHL